MIFWYTSNNHGQYLRRFENNWHCWTKCDNIQQYWLISYNVWQCLEMLDNIKQTRYYLTWQYNNSDKKELLQLLEQYWTMLDNIGYYWTILDNTGRYWDLLWNIRQYWVVLFNILMFLTISQVIAILNNFASFCGGLWHERVIKQAFAR